MAATQTVPQHPQDCNFIPITPQRGVVILFGYGIRVQVDRGHLMLEDGIGPIRREARFARVGHGLRRLVVIGADGMVSLAALRWLADQDASFVMLDRDGSVLATTGPIRPSDARLRRAQARAHDSGTALHIARQLIRQKLTEQERVVRDQLRDSAATGAIADARARLTTAQTIDEVRLLEAQAGHAYWASWRTVPILFPKRDLPRVPDHWRTFGTRISPLSGSPRCATNPPNAMLNYLYALLESEARLAVAALGLDPGLGFLHMDNPRRDSLACDLMEPIRPQVDAYLLNWITREPLRREWFFEQRDGNCRLMGTFATKLSETAPVWGKLVAPWAEYVACALWTTTSRSKTGRPLPTPLTQQHRRQAKGRPPFPKVEAPKTDSICRGCGKQIGRGTRYCQQCAVPVIREHFDVGRKMAQRPEFLAKRSATQRLHKQAIKNWKPSDLPASLTRDVYVKQILPALASVAKSRIRSALGVSEPYSSDIQTGKRIPHRRHWRTLAQLVGVVADE